MHESEHVGEFYETCRCGVSRRKARDGRPAGRWCDCGRCGHAWMHATAEPTKEERA